MNRSSRRAAEQIFLPPVQPKSPYDQVGDAYAAYADGHSDQLLSFDGLHAYADKCVWAQLSAKLRTLRAHGATSISILDAGCGPGTWLCRLVAQAHWLGFTDIRARGFDVAELQVAAARKKGRALARLPGVSLVFDVADLLDPLPEADATVDLTVCLYSVLSHLPREALPKVAAEFARVTRGHFITTVRAVGSMPTIFVDSLENARSFRQDHARDHCTVELASGAHLELRSHLFSARELESCFSSVFEIEDLSGLDLFHGRFTPDRRWNPAALAARDDAVETALVRLEEAYAHDPHLIDRANHLLLVARSRVH